jgi:maleylpyruvate isomerase
MPRGGHHDGGSPEFDARRAYQRAGRGMVLANEATARLRELAAGLDDVTVRKPSLLPGWTRAHVLTHLARNADGLLNLLTWARTGVEHPMYPSRADRDAGIEEGTHRMVQLIHEDLIAACDRFEAAAADLSPAAWLTRVVGGHGRSMLACEIPWLRWLEVSVHLVDLDRGVGFGDLPASHVEPLVDAAVGAYTEVPGVPPVLLEIELPNGRRRDWRLGTGERPRTVGGPVGPVLGWLTGRHDGSRLDTDLPVLPNWI